MTAKLIKLTDRYIETCIDDEVVLMDLDSGNFFSLTGTAATIWAMIDDVRDSEAIIACACTEYGCGAAEIAGDVSDFLQQMTEAGFIAAR